MPDFTTMVVQKNPGGSRLFRIPKAVDDRMQKELGCVTAGRHNRGLRWETDDHVGVVHFQLDFETTRHLYILPSESHTWNRSTRKNAATLGCLHTQAGFQPNRR